MFEQVCEECGLSGEEVNNEAGLVEMNSTHCRCSRKCDDLFLSASDQAKLEEIRLDQTGMSQKQKNDMTFLKVRDHAYSKTGCKVLRRTVWSLLGKTVCLDMAAHGYGISKAKLMMTKRLIEAGHTSYPEHHGSRMPSASDNVAMNAADAWWAMTWENLAEPLADAVDGEGAGADLPQLHEANVTPDHPLLLPGL